MATLRELGLEPRTEAPTSGLRDLGLTPQAELGTAGFLDQASANGMSQLRRGWTAGRLGAEANAMGADASSLRAAGRVAEADALAQRIAAVQQRAGVFAPAEQDVTQVGANPGRILDYGLGAVGQGAASMVEPLATSVGLGGAGRLLSAIPTGPTRLLGAGLQAAAPLAGGYLNYRQNKGEFYNDAMQDPETLRTQTPQQIDRAGTFHGVAAGALDTVLPELAARRFIGKGGVKALSGLGVAPRVGLDLLGEGVTEAGQEGIKKATLGYLNPNRDTSGDVNDYINSFAGGALGAGPISVASNLAGKGHDRLKAPDDLSSDDVSGKAPKNESLGQKIVREAELKKRRAPNDQEEAWRGTLSGMDGVDENTSDPLAFVKAAQTQHGALVKELGARAAKGDAQAQQHLDTLGKLDPNSTSFLGEMAVHGDAARDHLIGDGTNEESDDRLIAAYRSRKLNQQVVPGDLGGGKVTGGGDNVNGPRVPKETLVARENFRQRSKLTAEVMAGGVDPGRKRSELLKRVAKDLASEIVEFGAKGLAKPTKGDVARTARIGQQLVALYGRHKAEGMLDDIARTAAIDGTPLFKALRGHVILAADQAADPKKAAVGRAEAAKEMVAAVPPEVERRLRRDGVDLTDPDHAEALLGVVQKVFDGDLGDEPRLLKMFGKPALDAMREVVGQRIAPRAEREIMGEDVVAKENGAEDTSPAGSDDAVAKEEGGEFEARMAEKSAERAPGARQYFFKGRDVPADGAGSRNPFVRSRRSGLPQISKLDAVNHDGTNTLEHTEAKAYELLGFSPDSVKTAVRRGKAMRDGRRTGVVQRKTTNTATDGRHAIGITSAKDVMDFSAMADSKRLEVFGDYLDNDGLKRDRIAAIQKLDEQIEALKGDHKSVAKHAELRAQRMSLAHKLAEDADIKRSMGGKRLLYSPSADTTAADVANAYFADRHLVVADEMGGKDHLRIVLGEFREMTTRGQKLLDVAAKVGKEGGTTPAEKDRLRVAAEDDMNLIRFKTSFTKSKGDVAVPANAVVAWVNKNKIEYSKADREDPERRAKDFRNALTAGIAAMMQDGFMEGTPYMLDRQGKVESFADGFPPSLHLGPLTQAALNLRAKERVEKATKAAAEEKERRSKMTPRERWAEDRRVQRKYQTKVAAEQNAKDEEPARNTDADELVDEGKEAPRLNQGKKAQALREEGEIGKEDATRYWDAPRAETADDLARRTMGDKGEGSKRLRVPRAPTEPETVDTRSDKDRVPSELERDEQESGVPIERTDIAMRTATANAALAKVPTLTAANAMGRGKAYAEQLLGALRGDYQEGMARVKRVVSQMYAPVSSTDPNETVGGKFYAVPLAHLMTPDNLLAYPVMKVQRKYVARTLLSADQGMMTGAQKLQLARLLNGEGALAASPDAPLVAGEKLTIRSYPAFLEKLAERAAKVEAKVEPEQKAAPTTTEPVVRKLNQQTPEGVQYLDDGRRSLLSRLATDRRAVFANAPTSGSFESSEGRGTFGPLGKNFSYFFVNDGTYIHTAVVPSEYAARLRRFLSENPSATRQGDAVAYFAAQVVSYEQGSGGVQTFGPRPGSPVAALLQERGALGEANQKPGPELLSRVEGVSTREALAMLGMALAYAKHATSQEQVPVNWVRLTGKNIGKEGSGVLNAQAAQAATPATQAQVDEAKAYIAKVLGPKVLVAVEKVLGKPGAEHLGEWIEAKNLIELSLAAGPMLLSVAHHEAMHALFSTLLSKHEGAKAALERAMDTPRIKSRLEALLADHPAALAAIQGDTALAREERAAYAYQFWAAGELVIDKVPATFFAKVRALLRQVFGMVRDSETALAIMTAFHGGKLAEPSAAGLVIGKIMARQTWNEDVKRKFDAQIQHLHASVAVSNDVLRKSESATARALADKFFSNPGREGDNGAEGYLNARTRVVRQYTNFLYKAVKGLTEKEMEQVSKILQQPEINTKDVTNPILRKAVGEVRALTKRYYEYATKGRDAGGPGLDIEYLGDNYHPRVWDLAQLVDNRDKFVAMMSQPKYDKVINVALAFVQKGNPAATKADVIDAMHQHLMDKNGVDVDGLDAESAHGDVILSPFFASQKERSFKWLDSADVEPFLEKDLVGTMSRYLHQGIRAAEFARRFGAQGSQLRELTRRIGDKNFDGSEVTTDGPIAKELRGAAKEAKIPEGEVDAWVARRMLDIKNSVAAQEGSLGSDISPTWRKWSSAAMAYQNLRLLPLSLFAAFADPMGIAARGGGLPAAFDAFTQGLKDVWARWKDAASDMPAERVQSVWDKMAEAAGVVDSHMFLEQIGKAHTSEFMTDFARKSNRWLFMANGLTAWDRSMRVTATKHAALFIADHKSLPDKQHSARWLNELGLKPADIHLDAEGNLLYDRHEIAAVAGMPIAEATAAAEKIHYALTRWVEGAVLTPTAAQRPTWASDPRWAVLFHLKQFTYSFQDTILRRAANEAQHGNMNPVGALAMAVPTMMVSDVLKGFVQGGGALPAYMKAWGFGDHLMHGVSRAGLGGTAQFGVDALRDPSSLLGPTVEQAVKMVTHPADLGANLKDAVPGLRMLGGLPDLTRAVE